MSGHYSKSTPKWHSSKYNIISATASIDAKFCKIEKIHPFYTFWTKKNTHISGCKIVHLCTIATVTVHIYCSCAYHYFIYFFLTSLLSPSDLSLSLSLSLFLWTKQNWLTTDHPIQQPTTTQSSNPPPPSPLQDCNT